MTNSARTFAVAILALSPLTLSAEDTNQVSVQILNNGQSSLTVAPGQVNLQLDVRVSTNIGLAATQFSLDCSTPGSFVYSAPSLTIGSPFTADDLAFVPVSPAADDGVSLADHPLVTLFRVNAGNYGPELFPSVVLSYHIRSNGALPANTSYTFTLAETADQPSWVDDAEGGTPVTGKISVGTAGTFTLQVSNNPSTGFPPFCGTGAGPIFMCATMLGLWLISSRSRRR